MKEKISKERCYDCNGKMVIKSLPHKIKGIFLGNFPAEVCTKCGEIFFDEDTSRKMTKKAKEKGLWGLESVTKVSKIGDSLGVIINKKIIDFLDLKKGELVKIKPEGKNKIIIEI